jgi:hypothetical protein
MKRHETRPSIIYHVITPDDVVRDDATTKTKTRLGKVIPLQSMVAHGMRGGFASTHRNLGTRWG